MIIKSWVSLSNCGSRRLQHLNYIKRQRKGKFGGLFSRCPSVFRRKKIFPKSSSLGTLPAIPWGTSDRVPIVGSEYGETRKVCRETFPSGEADMAAKGRVSVLRWWSTGQGVKDFSWEAGKWGRPFREGNWVWAAAVLFGLWSQSTHLLYTPVTPVCLTHPLSLLTACSQVLKALLCLVLLAFKVFALFCFGH